MDALVRAALPGVAPIHRHPSCEDVDSAMEAVNTKGPRIILADRIPDQPWLIDLIVQWIARGRAQQRKRS